MLGLFQLVIISDLSLLHRYVSSQYIHHSRIHLRDHVRHHVVVIYLGIPLRVRLTLAFGEGFDLDDAVSFNWNHIEDILLPLRGVSAIRLYVDDADVFRWLLSVIPRGTRLQNLHSLRRVTICYRMMPLRDLRHIIHLSMHKKYPVVDRTVALSPTQTFDLLRIRSVHRESEEGFWNLVAAGAT